MLDWIELHPGLAAWVQAVGSIVAILVAVAVPAFQEVLRRRDVAAEKRLRAQSLSLMLLQDIMAIANSIAVAQRGQNPCLEQVAVPENVIKQIDNMWMMGPAGGHLLQLIATIRTHNRFALEQLRLGERPAAEVVRRINELGMNRLVVAAKECHDATVWMSHILAQDDPDHNLVK